MHALIDVIDEIYRNDRIERIEGNERIEENERIDGCDRINEDGSNATLDANHECDINKS